MGSKDTAFQKLVCNLLLNVHPICINKWSHPLNMKFIHQYYLNYNTICLEYAKNNYKWLPIRNINDTLLRAAGYNNILIIKWCLKNGAKNDKALPWVAKYGHLKIVRLLLELGADVHILGDSALHDAVTNSHIEVVKLLLDKGANVHSANDFALRSAILLENLEIIKILLDAGANVHTYDNGVLYHAVAVGGSELVKLLINKGADVHTLDNKVLCQIAQLGHSEIAELLSAAGADVRSHVGCSSTCVNQYDEN